MALILDPGGTSGSFDLRSAQDAEGEKCRFHAGLAHDDVGLTRDVAAVTVDEIKVDTRREVNVHMLRSLWGLFLPTPTRGPDRVSVQGGGITSIRRSLRMTYRLSENVEAPIIFVSTTGLEKHITGDHYSSP